MLGIIGGTGIYQIDELEIQEKNEIQTPFGYPSAPIIEAAYKGTNILFLPRHGEQHHLLPHEINYRANIYALKKLGAKQIIGFSAIGSLREEIQPGHLVIPSQYFDWTKGNRVNTFFGNGIVAHVSTAQPSCSNLTQWIANTAHEKNLILHTNKTYACVNGPRLGTKAESHFLRLAGCDVIGMTNVPEVFLAREAQLCYATIGIVTDFDCWMEDPSKHVTVSSIMSRYKKSLLEVKNLLITLLEKPLPEINPLYRETLHNALLTPTDRLSTDQQEFMSVLMS